MIAKANPTVNPNRIRVGQKLVIPKFVAPVPVAVAKRSSSPDQPLRPGETFYTIAKEDILWNIAARKYGQGALYPVILKANPDVRPGKLTPGRKIRIPSKKEAEAFFAKSPPARKTSSPAPSARTQADPGYVPGKPYFD